MRAFVLLALVACAHASSSYASGSASAAAAASPAATGSSATAASATAAGSAYGSGSASAAAATSAKAPAPAPKGNSTAPAPAPGPAPAPAPSHRVVSAIKLTGVTVAMFDASTAAGKSTRKAFQGTVADEMKVKPEAVVITGVKNATRRSGVAIDFYVKVKDAKAADEGVKTLKTALEKPAGAGSFASKLVAKAKTIDATLALAKADPAKITTTVTKAPEAKVVKPTVTPTAVASAPATAVVSMASVAFAALALC